ncbi:MAG: pyridoxal-phosphate dependent enzyme [Spirochaetaceae bacterium]|jgi:threonine synthase|nr:pyridoxal-phosphate dependent enzyme [Spirochaetaceae bacterium]
MTFRSTKGNKLEGASEVNFRTAVLQCLPPHGGLYVPSSAIDLRRFIQYVDTGTSFKDFVAVATPALLPGELSPADSFAIAEDACKNFSPEIKQLDENFSLLLIDTGPTGCYKDFGLAFLAALLKNHIEHAEPILLVTAAGDRAGISVAHAFAGIQGVSSVILYPEGELHGLDSSAFVTNGGNILPIQVSGSFDDCQRLVEELVADDEFNKRYHSTSANTINVGRLLPQTFYYLYAFIKIRKRLVGDLIFSVPSGNYGNLLSGLYAWKFGMPVNGFLAALNRNTPLLDVAEPANYERLEAFQKESPAVMKHMVRSVAVSDTETFAASKEAKEKYWFDLGPTGALSYAAALRQSELFETGTHTVIMRTVRPERDEQYRNVFQPVTTIKPELEALEGAISI